MKKGILIIINKIIHIDIRFVFIAFLVGGIFLYTGALKSYNFHISPELSLDQLERKEGLLESCKIIRYRSSEYLKIELQDGSAYTLRGRYYKFRDWNTFIKESQKGDKIFLLVQPKGNYMYEVEKNGSVFLSYEKSCQIRKDFVKQETPVLKIMIILGLVDFLIVGIILFFKIRYK